MESKDVVILSKKGLEKTILSRSNRCVGKCMSMIESVYPDNPPQEIAIIKKLIKETVHQEMRDLSDLLQGEQTVLFSNYKGEDSKK